MTMIADTILKQFRTFSGVSVSDDKKRIDLLLPGGQNGADSRITMVFPGGSMVFNMIDIRSVEIPVIVADPVKADAALIINYCHSGRCEIKIPSGECTYLAAGEIVVYAGQTINDFYYPSGEYQGFEVIVFFTGTDQDRLSLLEELSVSPAEIYDTCKDLLYPWIRTADEHIRDFYTSFSYYVERYNGPGLILLKCIELIAYLSEMDYSADPVHRTYCTASQVEIAKLVRKKIMSDLSVRLTAKALADEFGISETSLKNYFRNVYGCGYAEYQHRARMQEACALLENTDMKISEIGFHVGYATQTKFSAAFKGCYGVSPLEYRRLNRLKKMN